MSEIGSKRRIILKEAEASKAAVSQLDGRRCDAGGSLWFVR